MVISTDNPRLDRRASAPGCFWLSRNVPSTVTVTIGVSAHQGMPPELILIATGSEVSLALAAHRHLSGEGVRSRVVSMPSWELFETQPVEYRLSVLPPAVRARVSIEAGSPFGWERYVGPSGAIIGVDHFGASAPGPVVMAHYGFTVEHLVATAKAVLARSSTG